MNIHEQVDQIVKNVATEEERVADFVRAAHSGRQYDLAAVDVYRDATGRTVYMVIGSLSGYCADCKASHALTHVIDVVLDTPHGLSMARLDHLTRFGQRLAIPHAIELRHLVDAAIEDDEDDDGEEVTR